jgi:hypothetical protein
MIQNRLIKIGIDPGVHTGFAVYDVNAKQLIECKTFDKLHLALWYAFKLIRKNQIKAAIVEDARLWTYHKAKDWARAQGAGSVKRDSQIWLDFFNDMQVKTIAAQPNKTRNRMAKDVKLFKQLTSYNKRTSHHARVAAMLIIE